MGSAINVDPFRCRMWPFHQRLGEHLTEESCRDEIESVLLHGQIVPVLGRPSLDTAYDYELIFGARRLFIAQHLCLPLLMEVREMSDREAAIAGDIENRQRKDLSPYERGITYSRWLKSGWFASQKELARALNVSSSQISRLLVFSQLPSVLIAAFNSPTDICETWGGDLLRLWREQKFMTRLAQRARQIAKRRPRPMAAAVFEELLATTDGLPARARSSNGSTRQELIRSDNGVVLFRIRYQRATVAFLVPTGFLSQEGFTNLKCTVAAILQDATHQLIDIERTPRGHIVQEPQRPESSITP